MKKLVAVMLCCMMMIGALSAFANDGIMPLIDCDHSSGLSSERVTEKRGTCETVSYLEWTCDDCGRVVKETNVQYSYSHNWAEDVIDGETYCTKCGETK